MTSAEIYEKIWEAFRRTKNVRIVFVPEARLQAGKLIRMDQLGIVGIQEPGRENLLHFVSYGDWEQDSHRTILIHLNVSFEDKTCMNAFAKQMDGALESIEIIR